jgi:hypothetical protein
VRSHNFQNIYMHNYLCIKSCILVPDDGSQRPKHVVFIDDIIKSSLWLTVIYTPRLICHSTTGRIPLKFTSPCNYPLSISSNNLARKPGTSPYDVTASIRNLSRFQYQTDGHLLPSELHASAESNRREKRVMLLPYSTSPKNGMPCFRKEALVTESWQHNRCMYWTKAQYVIADVPFSAVLPLHG